jgi:hypothetical protein
MFHIYVRLPGAKPKLEHMGGTNGGDNIEPSHPPMAPVPRQERFASSILASILKLLRLRTQRQQSGICKNQSPRMFFGFLRLDPFFGRASNAPWSSYQVFKPIQSSPATVVRLFPSPSKSFVHCFKSRILSRLYLSFSHRVSHIFIARFSTCSLVSFFPACLMFHVSSVSFFNFSFISMLKHF